jgi:hypothetical protein
VEFGERLANHSPCHSPARDAKGPNDSFVLPQARWERFGVVEPLAAVLSVFPQARWERFGVVEPLAAVLSVFPQARWERFGVVEPLASVLSVFPQARCERFGVVEPLASVLSVFPQSRWERFGVVEPLAALLSPKAAVQSSFMEARFENVADLCERRGTVRVEAGDGCLFDHARHGRCQAFRVTGFGGFKLGGVLRSGCGIDSLHSSMFGAA